MTAPRLHARRGFALILAILIALLMGLTAASVDIALNGSNAGWISRRQALITDADEATALGYVLDEWPRSMRVLGVNGTASRSYTIDGTPTTVQVTEEQIGVYRFDLAATGATGTSIRSVRGYSRALSIPWGAPIVALGTLNLAGGTVDGRDAAPPTNTDCGSLLGDQIGAFVPAAANVVSDNATFLGSAPEYLASAPSLNTTALTTYGATTVDSLVAMANIVYPSTTTTTVNLSSALTSGSCSGWGSPTAVNGCESYYPVIYAPGPLVIASGAGQGILVADGNVTLQGTASFYGLIIQRNGTLTIQTNAANGVFGQIIQVSPAGGVTLASGTIKVSSCAVSRLTLGRQMSLPRFQGGLLDIVTARETQQ